MLIYVHSSLTTHLRIPHYVTKNTLKLAIELWQVENDSIMSPEAIKYILIHIVEFLLMWWIGIVDD